MLNVDHEPHTSYHGPIQVHASYAPPAELRTACTLTKTIFSHLSYHANVHSRSDMILIIPSSSCMKQFPSETAPLASRPRALSSAGHERRWRRAWGVGGRGGGGRVNFDPHLALP